MKCEFRINIPKDKIPKYKIKIVVDNKTKFENLSTNELVIERAELPI